jgi:hypothetical protein
MAHLPHLGAQIDNVKPDAPNCAPNWGHIAIDGKIRRKTKKPQITRI